MRTIAVIPARFRSSRLPGKALADLHGKTMVERVYERASRAETVDAVLVATDDERIRHAVEDFGGRAVMTSPDHPSGSDRLAEAVSELDVELVVNVQGDEPLLAHEAIDEAVRLARQRPGEVATLAREITDRKTLLDESVVKVVWDAKGHALYFSRSPIPAPPRPGEELPPGAYYEHLGLYVYPKKVLMQMTQMAPTRLELHERLEQLRLLENGIPISVGETRHESLSVDTPADLERVRRLLQEMERPLTMNHER